MISQVLPLRAGYVVGTNQPGLAELIVDETNADVAALDDKLFADEGVQAADDVFGSTLHVSLKVTEIMKQTYQSNYGDEYAAANVFT